MIPIFVYGSLKQGLHNHWLLHNAIFIDVAQTTEQCWDMISMGGFPAVIPGNKNIYGELYHVTPQDLLMLDHLEGHPDFYSRTAVELNNGQAWMYVLNPSTDYDNNKENIIEENNLLIWVP
jgi:gamma-glutamylcyclotransferase (GGCT)/AIG2-like uncharacterized protein YtfP